MRRSKVVRSGHDRLLDTIKSIAILRVIAWHTFAWPWLSWIPAMPTMFFANGALLHSSLDRRGWSATLRERGRRLLIPFWVYGVLCWVVMLATGWRPSWTDAFAWVLPLTDPTGADWLPGLWVPLWYIRAYVWFVIIAGTLDRVQEWFGDWAILWSSMGTVLMWIAAEHGYELPFALSDALGYLPFVLAGMVYRRRGVRHRPQMLVVMGLLSIIGAIAGWRRFGPADAVVNRSYLLMLLVGFAGVLLAVGFREPILGLVKRSERLGRLIRTINSRALTVYLWQGFGLVAADRLIAARIDQPVLRAVGSIAVVTAVVIASTLVFGTVEDIAARRIGWKDLAAGTRGRFAGHGDRMFRIGVTSLALIAVIGSIVVDPDDHDPLRGMPLSGRAVVARAEMIDDSMDDSMDDSIGDSIDDDAAGPVESNTTAEEIIDSWMVENADDLAALDLSYLHVVLMDSDSNLQEIRWGDVPGDEDPMAWWSMSKSITAGWMMQLVDQGVVRASDRLAEWVPEVPHAREITLEHLARHLSGIPTVLDGDMFDTDPISDIDRYVREGRLAATPGTQFNYSRIGYLLLGLALERASGTTWVEAVSAMARSADVDIGFDDDRSPRTVVTDPDGHGYRGALWASGGLVSSPVDLVGLVHWLFTDGLSSEAIDQMTRFSTRSDSWFYGLGLMPACPCEESDGFLRSSRFGLDSATGTYAVNRDGAVVLIRPSNWFHGPAPAASFFHLEASLLDHLEANGVT